MENRSPSAITIMLETYRRIVELQDRSRSLQHQLAQAEAYLRRVGSNRALGESQYDRLLSQLSETIAELREVGYESQRLLDAA